MPSSTGMPAATSNGMSSGTTQALAAGVLNSSACEPQLAVAVTCWPSRRVVTRSPTMCTMPATW